MNQVGQKIVAMLALGTFALVIGLGELRQAQAQEAKEPYPSMAPLDQYLMDRNAEIAMARSAAPEAISRDADVTAMKPQSKARMVSYALWSEGGWAHSRVILLTAFGTLNFEGRFATTRWLSAPSCQLRIRERRWYWLVNPKLRSSKA
jgi:hypothetical protein